MLALFGELDLATVDVFERALAKAEASGAEEICIDLSGLQFVDSSGIRALMAATRRAEAGAGRLVLLRGPEPVQLAFEACGTADLLPFAD